MLFFFVFSFAKHKKKQVYNEFDRLGLLNNTYFIYTSDHGFHLGQWGMGYDKRQLYEHDIRIPFYISGPGITADASTDIVALNIDIAPTIADLVSQNVPPYMDGRSLTEFMFNSQYHRPNKAEEGTTKAAGARANGIVQSFMVEYSGEADNSTGLVMCGGHPSYAATLCDSWNNTYQCVRTINGTAGQVNGTIYCRFICYGAGKEVVDCEPGTPESEGEYYEMDSDPYELNNLWRNLSSEQVTAFEAQVDSLLACGGQTECNGLRGDDPTVSKYIGFGQNDHSTHLSDISKLKLSTK